MFKFKRIFRKNRMRVEYRGDGIGVKGKVLDFLQDEAFQKAWSKASDNATLGFTKSGGGT